MQACCRTVSQSIHFTFFYYFDDKKYVVGRVIMKATIYAQDALVSIKDLYEGLRVNKSTVIRKANKQNWPFIIEKVNGGERKMFTFNTLPTDIQKALTKHRLIIENEQELAAQIAEHDAEFLVENVLKLAREDRLKDEQAERDLFKHKRECDAKFNKIKHDNPAYFRAKTRQWALRGYKGIYNTSSLNKDDARAAFAHQVNDNHVVIPPKYEPYIPAYHGERALNAGTIKNWEYAYDKHGIWGLKDNYGNRKRQSIIDQNDELKRIVLGALMDNPHIMAKKIKAYLEASYAHLNIVSEKSIGRFLTKWKQDNASVWTYIENPDKWKNGFMAAAGSHFDRIDQGDFVGA